MMKKKINEVAPSGWEGTVKAMKKHKESDLEGTKEEPINEEVDRIKDLIKKEIIKHQVHIDKLNTLYKLINIKTRFFIQNKC
jgi:hypothetical protein